MRQLIAGLHQFKKEIHANNEEFFDSLAKRQEPQALFITCSDSRVDPNLLTQTRPGELFILRNAGNILPIHGQNVGAEEATIEFAILALGIKDIIVCGHSKCGAMKGLLDEGLTKKMPAVRQWLTHANKTKDLLDLSYRHLSEKSKLEIAVQENVLVQLENLRTYPSVIEAIAANNLSIHGWVYEIESGEVYIYDAEYEQFIPVVYEDGHFHFNQIDMPQESPAT